MSTEAHSRDSILRLFRKGHRDWPSFLSDSGPAAEKAFFALDDAARHAAVDRQSEYVSAVKEAKGKICSYSVYLSEQRWEKLGGVAAARPVPARPFSRAWSAHRLAELLKPMATLPAFRPIVQQMIDEGRLDANGQYRDRIEKYGWPKVREMHDLAAGYRGVFVPSDLTALGELFESVRVGGAAYEAWKRLHEARQWPFLPDPGKLEFVQFPTIPEEGDFTSLDDAVAAALEVFERSLKGVRGDEHAA